MTAEDFKAQGNKAFSAGDFETAIKLFTQAIELDPSNHVLYSNSLQNYEKATADAEKTIQLKPDWAKGYSRKGAALHGLGNLEGAIEAYEAGLKLEPNNALLKKGLSDVQTALANSSNPIAKIFGPNMWEKIAANPRLSPYLAQPDLVQKLREIQANPQTMNMHLQDPRMMEVLMGLMDLDARVATNEDELEKAQSDAQADIAAREELRTKQPQQPQQSQQRAAKPEPAEPAASAKEEESSEEAEKKRKRAASDEAKNLGNAAYKKRQFEEALKHYEAAWEHDATNVAVLTNKAAVLFEMERYKECIDVCEQAVETGREVRADFKLIARALGRIGTSYTKLNDYKNAIKYFGKSLAEHRTADILEKLREAERIQKQIEEESYRDPALADEAREKGNELFKAHDYAGAVKLYTEAIKRNPLDARNYSNRAACYTKLMALPEADKDVDEALRLDPEFLKAHIRKAAILFAKRDYMRCIDVCEQVTAKDTEGKHTAEVQGQIQKAYFALSQLHAPQNRAETLARAQANPDVQRVLGDPVMQTVLKQMQEDPSSIKTHMANAMIADKVRTLINAGIIAFGR
nr:Hsp90 cochaperone [Polyrhizophydium stewartii]